MNCLESEIQTFDWRQRVTAHLLCGENPNEWFYGLLNDEQSVDVIKTNWAQLCGLNLEFTLEFIKTFPDFFDDCLLWIPTLKKWPLRQGLIYHFFDRHNAPVLYLPQNWRQFVIYFLNEAYQQIHSPLYIISFPSFLLEFMQKAICYDKNIQAGHRTHWRRCFRIHQTLHDFIPNISHQQYQYAKVYIEQLAIVTIANYNPLSDVESDGYETPPPSVTPTTKRSFAKDDSDSDLEFSNVPYNHLEHSEFNVNDQGVNYNEMDRNDSNNTFATFFRRNQAHLRYFNNPFREIPDAEGLEMEIADENEDERIINEDDLFY